MNLIALIGLKSKNPDTRRETIENLAALEDPEALKRLYPMLNDEDADVRKAAVKAIAVFKDFETVPPLLEHLNDPDAGVRLAVVTGLARINDKSIVDHLVNLLLDDDIGVRKKVASVLESFGWRAESEQQRALSLIAEGKILDAAREGAPAVEPLAKLLESSNSATVRQSALQALASISDPRILKLVSSALKDEEASVRVTAVEMLRKVKDARVFDPLVAALDDEDKRVRQAAAEILGQVAGQRATIPLVAKLRDEAWEVRAAAADSISRLEDGRAIDGLLAATEDPEGDVRIAVTNALAKIPDARSVPSLVALLTDSHPNVRERAVIALNRIDPNWQKSDLARAAVPELQTALYDKEYWVRQAASKTLSALENSSAIPGAPTLQMAGGGSSDTEITGAEGAMVEPLIAELAHPDPTVRAKAAVELGRTGSKRAIAPLERTLFDDNDGVRKAGAEALLQFNWEPSNSMIGAIHGIIVKDWDRVVSYGEAAVDPLITALEKFDPMTQKGAAEALGNVRDGRAVDPLLAALAKPDFGIRKAAAEALGKIGDPRAIEALINAQNDKFKPVRDAAEKALMALGCA